MKMKTITIFLATTIVWYTSVIIMLIYTFQNFMERMGIYGLILLLIVIIVLQLLLTLPRLLQVSHSNLGEEAIGLQVLAIGQEELGYHPIFLNSLGEYSIHMDMVYTQVQVDLDTTEYWISCN